LFRQPDCSGSTRHELGIGDCLWVNDHACQKAPNLPQWPSNDPRQKSVVVVIGDELADAYDQYRRPLKQKQWDNTGQVLSGRLHKNGAAALMLGALGLKFG
jgi:hypothetical protein